MIRELKAGDIVLSYGGRSFSGIEPGCRTVGQERALGLLRMGLSIDRIGYNIFLSGDDGSGRLNAVLNEIESMEPGSSSLKDAAYCWNPDGKRPRVLLFHLGTASAFQEDLSAVG